MHTDRGDLTAPLIVDALGWRRMLASDGGFQPPDAPLSRGLEVHPGGAGDDLEIWIDRRYVPAGYGWSFPARDELRIGVGSFDPRFHVKDTTVELAEDLGADAVRYQGNWIPHKLRPATEDGIFFAGDSAGHCLPLTAEGIRTALYFGIALRPRAARGGRGRPDARAGAAPATAQFSPRHAWKFAGCCACSGSCRGLPPRAAAAACRAMCAAALVDWSFAHYLGIAPAVVRGRARRAVRVRRASPRRSGLGRRPRARRRRRRCWARCHAPASQSRARPSAMAEPTPRRRVDRRAQRRGSR